jgi:hypothetical protein
MAPPAARENWVYYEKHRLATVAQWGAGTTLSDSIAGNAQYNPNLVGSDAAVEAVEWACISTGIVIRETANKVTKYLHLPGIAVGACSGEYTEYVFAEATSGFFHGRPICMRELRRLGAKP